MGRIKGTIVYCCISFLAFSWPGGNLGESAGVSPFLKRCSVSDSVRQPSPDTSSTTTHYVNSATSVNPSYETLFDPCLISQDYTVAQKQLLLNQAKILLGQTSHSASADTPLNIETPCSDNAIEKQEKILLRDLIDRLESFKNNNPVAVSSSLTVPVVSKDIHTLITNQYINIKLLSADVLTPSASQTIVTALNALYETFDKIVTGQLLNDELPNLCSKILALTTQLNVTDAPTTLQDLVCDFLASITLALTGQNQITMVGVCNCLNDLESSIVTVVENDESRRLQYLLSHLVEAVTNAVASGRNVGHNVIGIVKRYITTIKRAVQEENNARSGKIYSSVLQFEEKLYQTLVGCDTKAITVTTGSQVPTSLSPKSDEDITNIHQQIKLVVKSELESLLSTKKSEDPSSGSVIPTSTDGNDASKINDATDIITNGQHFVIKKLVPKNKQNNTYESGTYKFVDPKTKVLWNGNFLVLNGPSEQDQYGTIHIESSGFFQVDLPGSQGSQDNRQANFRIKRHIEQVNVNGKSKVIDSGSFTVTDSTTGTSKSGRFVVTNSVTTTGDNDNMKVTISGVLYVDEVVVDKTDVDKTNVPLSSTPPLVQSSSTYFLFEDHISKNPESDGIIGTGRFAIENSKTNEYHSGDYVIHYFSRIENPDKSVDLETKGVIYAIDSKPDSISDNPNSTWVIIKGSPFTCIDHIQYVMDMYGRVSSFCTGIFSVTNSNTGIITSGHYEGQRILETNNQDGTTDITKFGQFLSVDMVAASTDLSSTPISSSKSNNPPVTDSGKQTLTVSKEAFEALVESLDPGAYYTQHGANHSTKQDSPVITNVLDSAGKAIESAPYSDATSILSDGTSFIIRQLITPLLDPEGNVIGTVVMGTYHFMNIDTNISWSGAFEVDEAVNQNVSLGHNIVTAFGTFDVTSPNNECYVDTLGKFSIEGRIDVTIRNDGTVISSETGTYTVTDLNTDTSKSGIYKVENTVSRPQPDGAIELIKSGWLFLDASHGVPASLRAEPIIPGYTGYYLCDENILDSLDSDRNYKNGVYSIKDVKTNEYLSGSFDIQSANIIENGNGTVDMNTLGVIYVDGFDPKRKSGNSDFFSIIMNGVAFATNYHLEYVTGTNGNIGLIGKGKFTQTDPETGILQAISLLPINIVKITDTDGLTKVWKFGLLRVDNCDDLSKDPPTTSGSTTTIPSNPFIIQKDDFKTLVDSLNPGNGKSENSSLAKTDKTSDTSSPSKNQLITEAKDIVTNGASFIIDGHVVPLVDNEGNSIGILKGGSFKITDSRIKTSWTGSFIVDDFFMTSISKDELDITASGTYNVISPQIGVEIATNFISKANFMIKEHVSITVDSNGATRKSGIGTFQLTNPDSGESTTGAFDTYNTISKVNSDGSIYMVQSGILHTDKPYPSDQSDDIKYGGYFLTAEGLLVSPNSDGDLGLGVYHIKDPVTNEYTTGNYVIRNASEVKNPDGTLDVTRRGFIYVDSQPVLSDEPSLIVINGSEFAFIDHLSVVTDKYGHEVVLGTGVFEQMDPLTNVTRSGKYIIQNVMNGIKLDGTWHTAQTGIFYYTNNNDANAEPSPISSSPSDTDESSTTQNLGSDKTLSDLEKSLQGLLKSVEALKIGSDHSSGKQASDTTSDSENLIASTSIVLPRASVVSAINGQSLSDGDVITVDTNSGAILLSVIEDSCSSVTFSVIYSRNAIPRPKSGKSYWSVQEDDFSKQDRGIIDAALEALTSHASSTCKT